MPNVFEIKKDGHVFLNGIEIDRCTGVDIHLEPLKDPEIGIRVEVDRIDVDDYMEPLKRKERENKDGK